MVHRCACLLLVRKQWRIERYGVPQPELSAAGSGDNPGRVSGWLGTQKNARDKHMRVSSAGPGFLARLPPPQPVFTSGYTMSRHLHYALMSACADATTSLEGAAACVRQHGQSVQKALQYLLYGPTVAERKAAREPNGVFADRTFQRYLQSDAYLIGEDWPRSVIRFPDHNQDANAAADTSATAKNTAAPETAEEAEACVVCFPNSAQQKTTNVHISCHPVVSCAGTKHS